jgi:ornithine cyclodeaminase
MPTLILTRSDVERLLEPAALAPALRDAFIAYSAPGARHGERVRATLPGSGTATVLFPGVVAGVPAYSVKVHAKFPGEDPAIRGVLCLHDAATGTLLSLMDSTYLTAVRTGLAGALAAKVLARRDAGAVAVIGAGAQGEHQLRALALLRRIAGVRVYDTRAEQARTFAGRLGPALGVPVVASPKLEDALGGADIVLVATWARTPFLGADLVQPGMHVTTLGADEPGKAEVTAEVVRGAVFVCDDRELAVRMGAVGGVGLDAAVIDAELGEVLAGRHPGRTSPHDVTVYGGVGLAFQDLVAAWIVYEAARARGVGREVDLLA